VNDDANNNVGDYVDASDGACDYVGASDDEMMGDDGVRDIVIPTQIINDCKSMGTKYRSNNYKR
jgi:hypothetical protein